MSLKSDELTILKRGVHKSDTYVNYYEALIKQHY